tara:strand:- start:124 stop:384 length:261 start_codon:yes stop_codon:yes gene_type:complete
MTITKQVIAEKLASYLRHECTSAELVSWAETAMMEREVDEADAEIVSAALARLGVADVRAFGLEWADCESILRDLGFEAQVEITAA